ncbi:probable L-type lectin-domain containing receptor kinase S.7 [Elaeis guineensis]|uniref:non-specific serine/threonine protein kinase n=1 Tax=Elaeis guineensis var. tenera TaxID=51953 RepID=A0A6I9SGE1_ELAGV|nr:probable L-type lectin-domain containing receptor kinase S.7 [Elaeis guineensis]
MDSPSRTFLLLSLSLLPLLLLPTPASSKNICFDFRSFSLNNLTLLGDSYLRNGAIGLDRDTGNPSSSSSGTAVFNLPIQFSDPRTNTSASFSTSFSFKIANPSPDSHGDGLTFFISPDSQTLGSVGPYLGLFDASSTIKNGSAIAVEFDTVLDEYFGDPSDNHVGLDISSPRSLEAVDLWPLGIDLRSGNPITAWIDYHGDEQQLKIWVGYSSAKPERPVLSTRFGLSKHFTEYMYVGFSASAVTSAEVHQIESWTFQTFGLPSLNLSPRTPHNASDILWSVIPARPDPKPGKSSHKKLTLGLGIMGPAAFCVALILFVYVSLKKRMEIETDKESFKPEFTSGPRQFRYRELCLATRDFHRSRIIASGGFSTIYKAIHAVSGITYAVKRSKQSEESKNEFIAELSIIAGLKHKNLVQLQGWCTEKDELLLVYEFMPNGSLDKVLYSGPDAGTCPALSWAQRFNIAAGLASVLMYLHQECEPQVIHRDIKTSHVLLDAEFNPKLGDFGLARLMERNKSPVSTLTAGTLGYLAPEYLQYGKATEKTDVFSYGVVVLEVCSGRRPVSRKDGQSTKHVNLVDWVWGLYSEDKLIEAADGRLNGEFDGEEMLRLLLIGLSCANPNSAERPSMVRALQILNSEAEPMAVPRKKPCLTFTSSTPMTTREIVSDCNDSAISSQLYELKID